MMVLRSWVTKRRCWSESSCFHNSPVFNEQARDYYFEQPELHLHPALQNTMADFLWFLKNQIYKVVETHSEHFVNRLRLRIAVDETWQ